MLALLVATAVTLHPVEVRKAGDDGLTNRFTDAYMQAIDYLVASARPLKATVEQIRPLTRHTSQVTIQFELQAGTPQRLTCTFSGDAFKWCVRKAAKATKKLAAKLD
jgi:uncharacterized protein (DUF427 family)